MPKHTPGPWSISPNKAMYGACGEGARKLEAVGLPTQFEGLSIGTYEGQIAIIPLDESNEDNALLIAAAPELLHYLKDLIEQINQFPETAKGINTFFAQQAIAKAEGGGRRLNPTRGRLRRLRRY